MIRFVSIIDS